MMRTTDGGGSGGGDLGERGPVMWAGEAQGTPATKMATNPSELDAHSWPGVTLRHEAQAEGGGTPVWEVLEPGDADGGMGTGEQEGMDRATKNEQKSPKGPTASKGEQTKRTYEQEKNWVEQGRDRQVRWRPSE